MNHLSCAFRAEVRMVCGTGLRFAAHQGRRYVFATRDGATGWANPRWGRAGNVADGLLCVRSLSRVRGCVGCLPGLFCML